MMFMRLRSERVLARLCKNVSCANMPSQHLYMRANIIGFLTILFAFITWWNHACVTGALGAQFLGVASPLAPVRVSHAVRKIAEVKFSQQISTHKESWRHQCCCNRILPRYIAPLVVIVNLLSFNRRKINISECCSRSWHLWCFLISKI